MRWLLQRGVQRLAAFCHRPGASVARQRRFAVGAGQHDGVAVEVAQPDLPVGRTARLALGRVAVHGEHDVGAELAGPGDGLVEVLDLEPQQHPVAADQRGVADRPVVVVDLEVVQLEDEPVAVDQTLVLLPAVVAATALLAGVVLALLFI